MSHIDLHLHTTYSDGMLTPREVVTSALSQGVTLLAITDHDEVGGILQAQAVARESGIRLISGVEINTEVGREDVHILGYGFNADSPLLLAGLAQRRQARLQRTGHMVARLNAMGYPLELASVLHIAGKGSVGRPHIARALVAAGFVSTPGEAFERLIGNRCPAYVPRPSYLPEEAIKLIHTAGGITSLAHPGKLGDPMRIIRRLCEVGLDALEAYHSDHLPAVTERLLRWAAEFKLAVTGGTDNHGPQSKRLVTIGSVPVPDAVGERLLQLLGNKTNIA